jgi:hypothetical protein
VRSSVKHVFSVGEPFLRQSRVILLYPQCYGSKGGICQILVEIYFYPNNIFLLH